MVGALALSWGGLARIGEVYAGLRKDFVLPKDVGERLGPVLLSILEPKARFKTARHQAGSHSNAPWAWLYDPVALRACESSR